MYPYKGAKTKLKCPTGKKALTAANLGARVSKAFWTYNGTEEIMRKLVVLHGAVLATVTASGPLSKYTGGVFEGCEPGKKVDHAVTVVGFGREKGKDFWLIKNSWGPKWGERGYFKLRRGVGMCGIGRSFSAIECEAITTCEEGSEDCEYDVGAGEEEEEDQADEEEEEGEEEGHK
jgi:hypothetical protein